MPAIRVPTLVLHRSGDMAVSVEAGRYISQQIAGAKYVELPSNDHLPMAGDRAWRQLLDRHDTAAREEVARFRGRAVKSLGDGLLATFDGPARAVRCAAAIGERVRPLGIEVRSGLHTGEIELRGEDVAGIAVHIAARVAETAAGGEVVVSSTVKDLVAGSGLVFDDHGSHALKGLPEPLRLFAAHA